ncbi:MAG: hypothetical protein JKY55_10885 [Aliivibrio sp.]|uniref:hypothetical protein n=1 Tax=Aliivibrio sp. TaxID=1872443 RepID=UPI001A597353|nr:hypothetical protein [Aliivibrio sp.]
MKIKLAQALLCVIGIFLVSACAELKETGRVIGHGTRDITTSIGHASRDAAKSISESAKKVIDDANNSD